MSTHGAVDLSTLGGPAEPVDTTKAATTAAPEDSSTEDVRAVMTALTETYDEALARRQATMAVLPMKAMARAAIAAMGRFPAIPDYDEAAAPDARYVDRHRPEIDPEEFHVPSGGELTPDLLPEVSHAMVWHADGAVQHMAVDVRREAAVELAMTPDEAERYHLAGLAAVHAARANVARQESGG